MARPRVDLRPRLVPDVRPLRAGRDELAPRLEEDLHPGGLALAVQVVVRALAARPLREHDPAQVGQGNRHARGEGGEELRVTHAESIVTARPGRMGRPAYRYRPRVPAIRVPSAAWRRPSTNRVSSSGTPRSTSRRA